MAGSTFPFTDGYVITAAGQNEAHSIERGIGDGSDGAYDSDGNDTITAGQIYQHTTFTLNAGDTMDGTATATGLPYVILVQGDCVINGDFDFSGDGYSKENGADDSYYSTAGNAGMHHGAGSGGGGGGAGHVSGSGGETKADAGGSGGKRHIFFHLTPMIPNQNALVFSGTGGGDGGGGDNGGVGGGSLMLIVGGDLTFGAASGITLNGTNGGDTNDHIGAGGGGGAGCAYVLYYGTLTDGGVSWSHSAGSGGTASGTGGNGGNGGAGTHIIRKYDAVYDYP